MLLLDVIPLSHQDRDDSEVLHLACVTLHCIALYFIALLFGESTNTRTATAVSFDPTYYKTIHNRIPITKPNWVSWADRVRGNNATGKLPQDTFRTGYFDTIGKYATNLVRLI